MLSKSSFIKGSQCQKYLYLNTFHKELKDKLSNSQQAIFLQGNKVGELAQGLFPNGINLKPEVYSDVDKSVNKTKDALSDNNTVFYEPAFIYDEVFCAVDILVKESKSNSYIGYEVKSSTEIKSTYILDAAIQYYLLTNSGIKLNDFFIVYINNEYVKQGELDINQLFIKKSVLEQILGLQLLIPAKIKELKAVLDTKDIPNIDIGVHCSNPNDCEFIGHCWKNIPDYSLFDIAQLRANKKFELYNRGIIELKQIPKSFTLNDKQWQQVDCELNKKTIIDRKSIKTFIEQIEFPIRFLDFETFQNAIPIYDNSRAYQQMASQYSLHTLISKDNNALEHSDFLAKTNGLDPRIDFIHHLINDCGNVGDILIYNIAFERSVIEGLIKDFPEYEMPLQRIIDRLKDLMIPFRERMYYTPEMKGSYSIKKVLPALCPELSYKGLEISEGGTASAVFASMVDGSFEGDVDKTRRALLSYCELDTFAMYKIYDKLKSVLK